MSPKDVLRPLILASTSRSRALLLQRLGLPFQGHDPGVDEAEQAGESPRDRALRLAEAKAAAIASRFPEVKISCTVRQRLGNCVICLAVGA